jgi:hypothetical protein
MLFVVTGLFIRSSSSIFVTAKQVASRRSDQPFHFLEFMFFVRGEIHYLIVIFVCYCAVALLLVWV